MKYIIIQKFLWLISIILLININNIIISIIISFKADDIYI